MARPGNSSQIIVAGSFASAGAQTACQSICSYDAQLNVWSALGTGLVGAVSTLDFAGVDGQYLVAAGAFQLGGATAYVAQYDFAVGIWSGLPGAALAGPVSALAVDDGNAQNIFAAGQASGAAATPFVVRYNGSAWSDAGSSALSAGLIHQLAFVPLVAGQSHAGNALIESDRMLMASGAMTLAGVSGSVAGALYDGATWTPVLVATNAPGAPSYLSRIVYSASSFQLSRSASEAASWTVLTRAQSSWPSVWSSSSPSPSRSASSSSSSSSPSSLPSARATTTASPPLATPSPRPKTTTRRSRPAAAACASGRRPSSRRSTPRRPRWP